MILDKGVCEIYSVRRVSEFGEETRDVLTLRCRSWYGELDFATTPVETGQQEAVEVSARIRILQNRAVQNKDVAILGGVRYEITRAFHGTDKDNGQMITDLTLRRVTHDYDA